MKIKKKHKRVGCIDMNTQKMNENQGKLQVNRNTLGIKKIKKYYADGRTLKLITCMALREAGERHHDNAGEAGNYRQ